MAKFGVGQPVRRVEDQRFITGTGRYTDDIDLPGQVHGCVVRSPEAHARIKSLDIDAAKAAPGVLAVITGADIEARGGNALPCGIPMENRDGSKGMNPLRPVLCTERVRHVGDNVAFVVAETLEPGQGRRRAGRASSTSRWPWSPIPRARPPPASRWSMTTCRTI